MKKICLVLLVGLFLSLACTRDKNPASPEKLTISPGGKAISDFGSFYYLSSGGQLWTWGKDTSGVNTKEPSLINNPQNIIDFETREGVHFAADANGHIWAWGWWGPSAIALETVVSPQIIANLPGIVSIDDMGHILLHNGSVWQVDLFSHRLDTLQTPAQLPGVTNIKQISSNLAIDQYGNLQSLTNPPRPADRGGFIPLSNIKQVQNSTSHSVILKTDGSVWAWGNNGIGELGNGTTIDSAEPVKVLGMDNVVQISVRYHFNLALKADGSVWYWGFTAERDADNKPIGIHTPERIETDGPVASIQAGGDCMLIQQDGTLWTFNIKDRVVHQIVL